MFFFFFFWIIFCECYSQRFVLLLHLTFVFNAWILSAIIFSLFSSSSFLFVHFYHFFQLFHRFGSSFLRYSFLRFAQFWINKFEYLHRVFSQTFRFGNFPFFRSFFYFRYFIICKCVCVCVCMCIVHSLSLNLYHSISGSRSQQLQQFEWLLLGSCYFRFIFLFFVAHFLFYRLCAIFSSVSYVSNSRSFSLSLVLLLRLAFCMIRSTLFHFLRAAFSLYLFSLKLSFSPHYSHFVHFRLGCGASQEY